MKKEIVDKEDKDVREEKRRAFERSQPRRDRPTGILEVYGVGRNRSALRYAGRRPEVVQPKQNVGVGTKAAGELSFVQISDSHMGFNKPANPDVVGTLKAAVDKINGLAIHPSSSCIRAT